MTSATTIRLRHDTDEALAWQRQQDADAQAHLQGLAGYQRFLEQLTELEEPHRAAAPVRRGARWFQLVDLTATSEQQALVVGSAPGQAERILVDPDALSAAAGEPVSLACWSASPSGRWVAYALMHAGTERADIHVLDVSTGEQRQEDFPYLSGFGLHWLDDDASLWLSSRELDATSFTMSLRLHRLGGAAAAAEPLPPDALFPRPVASGDGEWVVALCGNTEVKAAYLRGPDGVWKPFLRDLPGGSSGVALGRSWVTVLEDEDARGHVVRIPFDTHSDRSTWQVLVPVSADVLRQVHTVGDDLIVIGYQRDAACGLRVVRADGTLVEEIALPGRGTVSTIPFGATHPGVPMVNADADGFSFVFTTFDRSCATYRWESETGLRLLAPPARQLDGVRVELIHATSKDGTIVPAHVLRPTAADGPLPTIVHGYGGFNVAMLPAYKAEAAAWVAAGGAYVLAHLRGGSEFGATWWRAGRMANKQNTFDDLYAVAEELGAQGISSKIAVNGASNGGLLVGVALVQRPELWAAVVSEVPVLELLDLEGEPFTAAIAASEYGNAGDPEQRAWLEAYSPLHNVQDATAYPPLLVVSGENDPRCPAWHGRLFVDAVRRASTSGAPALLRVPTGQGHGAQLRSTAAAQRAEVLAFAAEHTDLALEGATA